MKRVSGTETKAFHLHPSQNHHNIHHKNKNKSNCQHTFNLDISGSLKEEPKQSFANVTSSANGNELKILINFDSFEQNMD